LIQNLELAECSEVEKGSGWATSSCGVMGKKDTTEDD